MKKPPLQVGVWDSSRNAAAASAAGYSPQIEKGAPQTPWAAGYAGDAKAAGPDMSIPGAAQAAQNGALPWQMKLMYGGY